MHMEQLLVSFKIFLFQPRRVEELCIWVCFNFLFTFFHLKSGTPNTSEWIKSCYIEAVSDVIQITFKKVFLMCW